MYISVYSMFDAIIVSGIGNINAISTSKIMKIIAIKKIMMRKVVMWIFLGQTHIQMEIFFSVFINFPWD